MNKIILLFTFLFLSTVSYAQGEANIWYFGDHAGLDFNSGSPVALTDGQLNTLEGCATISNSSGQLLFYTDGVTVYNRNHVIMLNGTGLLGHSSSTQSATIVPIPGSTNLYFIFTIDAEAHANGFRYSVVDMNLDSGNGAIILSQKNILIYTPSTEKLAIVKHSNDTDFWVVTHGWNNNTFYSHLLTSTGLNGTPIVSNVGTIINDIWDSNAIGCMKIAPNGNKLIIANQSMQNCELFDFNNTTGTISNPIILLTELNYGVEFSNQSNLVYVSALYPTPPEYKIMQYDLNASNIATSGQVVFSVALLSLELSSLQLASNGKIYIAQKDTSKLGVIDNPNVLGLGCNVQIDAVDLLGKQCRLGLPPFITSIFNTSFNTNNLCLGNSTNFSLTTSQIPTSISWDFGDGSPTSSAVAPIHTYATAGTYTVTVTATVGGNTSTKSKSITISAVPIVATAVTNQSVCESANATYNLASHSATLLGGQSTATYGVAYFTNATDLSNHANALATAYALPVGVTTIYAKVYNLNNTACFAQNSFTVTKYLQPIANNITDMVYCQTPYTGTH